LKHSRPAPRLAKWVWVRDEHGSGLDQTEANFPDQDWIRL